MEKRLKPLFNELSGFDRLKLRGAALTTAMSGIAREDTKKAPWRYPFYAAYMLLLFAPIPIPGSNAIPMIFLVGFASLRLTPWSRWANERFSHCFNHKSLIENHKDCIEEDPERSGIFRVKSGTLAWQTTKTAAGDSWEATKIFGRSVGKLLNG